MISCLLTSDITRPCKICYYPAWGKISIWKDRSCILMIAINISLHLQLFSTIYSRVCCLKVHFDSLLEKRVKWGKMDHFSCRAVNEFNTNRFLVLFYTDLLDLLHVPKPAALKDPFFGYIFPTVHCYGGFF